MEALLPTRQDTHPLGCHRPRIPDRIVFDKLIQLLVFGCGYRRIADHTCSATTLRRRRDEWISAGVAEQLRLAVLAAYDRMHGLELEHLAVDGCTTKAPCGGQTAGTSPVDRRKQGLKRSMVTDAGGIPLGAVPAPANRRDDGLLAATLDTIRVVGGAAPAASGAPGRRLRLPALPAGPGRTRDDRPDRHAGHPGTDPGGPPLGDRTHPCLGQPVRQAALVHRAAPAGGGVLAGAGQRPSSSVAGCSAAPGPATAGRAALATAHDHSLAQTPRRRFAPFE
jgi:transposase